MARFNTDLRRRYGISGVQLALLRLLDEWGPEVRLLDLRDRMAMHPATVGQHLERLSRKRLTQLCPDKSDRRRRIVTLTPEGRALVNQAPLAGPVRLRHHVADVTQLRRFADVLCDAIYLFGLEDYRNDTA